VRVQPPRCAVCSRSRKLLNEHERDSRS
jgi:hypothetical protein